MYSFLDFSELHSIQILIQIDTYQYLNVYNLRDLVMIAEEKNTKVQSELRRMDKDIENELKERELIVQELKETTASKKDLEASLEQITKVIRSLMVSNTNFEFRSAMSSCKRRKNTRTCSTM